MAIAEKNFGVTPPCILQFRKFLFITNLVATSTIRIDNNHQQKIAQSKRLSNKFVYILFNQGITNNLITHISLFWCEWLIIEHFVRLALNTVHIKVVIEFGRAMELHRRAKRASPTFVDVE